MIAAAPLAASSPSPERPACVALATAALITGPVPTAYAAATKQPHFCWSLSTVSAAREERFRLRSLA